MNLHVFKYRFLDNRKELEQMLTSSMIPVLYSFDLDHQINIKCDRYRFQIFDRYIFLNLNFDRWKFQI